MRAVALVALIAAGCGDNSDGWRPIFDGHSLSGWSPWLAVSGRDHDPSGIFRVEDGMIHVLGVDLAAGQFEFGYLSTVDDFANVRIRFSYQWGPRRFVSWGPDSGFFVGVSGVDQVWPKSLECQVAGGDTGSAYVFANATASTTIDPAIAAPQYLDAGTPYVTPRVPDLSRVAHEAAVDSLTDWNDVEITIDRDEVEFAVNGTTTFRATGLRQPSAVTPDDPTADVALTGKLAIQNEGNEIWYRDLEVQPIYH